MLVRGYLIRDAFDVIYDKRLPSRGTRLLPVLLGCGVMRWGRLYYIDRIVWIVGLP